MVPVRKVSYHAMLALSIWAVHLICASGTALYAASINVAWNANSESDLAGYRIYYGTSSGNYTSSAGTGRVTGCTLSNLTEGRTYYIAMSAFDASGNESRKSAEIRGIAQNSEPTAQTVYEDAEDGLTAGWTVYDKLPGGAKIDNIYDGDRQSDVIELTGSGTLNGYRLGIADGSDWHNETQRTIRWSMSYTESFIVYIDLETTAGHRYLVYRPLDDDQLGLGEYVYFGLGTDAVDGQWHTYVRDLQADLNEAQPGVTILEVNGFLIRGSGLVDDISMLSYDTSGGNFSTTIEAEDMSYHANGGKTGDYWCLWSNGTMGEDLSFPAGGTYRFEVIAKATLVNSIGANMELLIDGETIGSVFVNSTTLQTYTFNAELSEGTHEIAIGFLNDCNQPLSGLDRNLYVDKIVITFIDSQSFSTIIEAEDMGFHANGGQSGDYWCLWSNGTMDEEVYFSTSGAHRFEIIAKSTLANSIGVEMKLIVDGETVGSVFVNSTTPQTYVFNAEVSAGTHEVAIGFLNDYCDKSAGLDRNLYVDKMIITSLN